MGFRGVDVEGVTLGDSPNAETMLRGMPDFSASTGSLGSGKILLFSNFSCRLLNPNLNLNYPNFFEKTSTLVS